MSYPTKKTFSVEGLVKCLNFWKEAGVYSKWHERQAEDFVIYPGPPYTNGNMHIGHAVNQILKDAINRFKALQGYRITFVMAWDCHGLPIEAGVENSFKAKGVKRQDIPTQTMILECRKFAEGWIKRQRESILKLGFITDPKEFFTTMDHSNEIAVVEFLHYLAREGLLVRKMRPVIWSCEEGTALADAEVEHYEKKSKSVDLLLKITSTNLGILRGAYVAIWTTTPWTLPANRAVAYGEDFIYSILEVSGKKIVVLSKLVEQFIKRCGITEVKTLAQVNGKELSDTQFAHPLDPHRKNQPLLPSSHVAEEQGTGFVHIAPDHGLDDFYLCGKNNIACVSYIDQNGQFCGLPVEMSFLNGKFYTEAIDPIIEKLAPSILGINEITHSYPHSWRSKKPVIFRATNQWFIEIEREESNLKKKVLEATEEVGFYPGYGKNRFTSTVASRESWCISRQRLWGVPFCFLCKNGEIQLHLLEECIKFVKENGVHAWYDQTNFDSAYEKIIDTCDVWIDSGLVYKYFERKTGIKKAQLMIEGSDQHRCWFQSTAYCAKVWDDFIPTEMICTHGYVVDNEGKKMSKSKANGLSPDEIIETYGLDCLRLWVLTKDYSQDFRIAKDHFEVLQKVEQKVRNTLKFLLANGRKHYSTEDEAYYSLLDKWALHGARKIQLEVLDYKKTITSFSVLWRDIYNYCDHILSKIYFDAIKESLYFDHPSSHKKKSAEDAMYRITILLLHWIAPFMPIAAEEYWQKFSGEEWKTSIHSNTFPKMPLSGPVIYNNIEKLLDLRVTINQHVEKIRTNSEEIKNASSCHVTLAAPIGDLLHASEYTEALKEVCGLSEITVIEGPTFEVKLIQLANGERCEKCRKYKIDIINGRCQRCAKAHLPTHHVS